MSVVAGCSLIDGVLLAADCRMTVKRRGRKDVHIDNLQKLFPLNRTTVIGFVSDSVEVAATLLHGIIQEQVTRRKKGKADPLTIRNWLPRFCRHKYALTVATGKGPPVAFMVASVDARRPQEVERAKIVGMMHRLRYGRWRPNWLPSIFMKILRLPVGHWARLLGCPLGMLYTLKSPDFVPRDHRCFDFAAIGSGRGVMTEIDEALDLLASSVPDTSSVDIGPVFAFREALAGFVEERDIEDVGGSYPCVKINASGVRFCGYTAEIPIGGTRIELSLDQNGRVVQRNLSTGKEIKLILPWEIGDLSTYSSDQTFDDVKDARKRTNRNRQGLPESGGP